MKRSASYFLILLFLLPQLAVSQTSNISGKWTGISYASKKQFPLKMEIKQEGAVLTGTVYNHSLDNTIIGHYEFNGVKEGNKVTIKGTKFIEKKGLTCLPTLELSISEGNEKLLLTGKWKHNLIPEGCWLGFSGKVELSKSKPEIIEVAASSKPELEYDALSQEIVNRLKTRINYALIIGAEDYQSDEVATLDRPVEDAIALKQILTSQYTFTDENVTLLKNPTRSNIIEAFDELAEKVESLDNLLVFYAGHGIWDEKLQQGYWLPVDAKKNSKAQWLSNGTIRDYLGAIDSKHTLLIADACFSGGILKERAAFNTSRAMVELYKLPSRKAITSGTLKTVPDKSVFLKYLIEGLKQNEHAIVSAHQLFANLRVAVIHNSPNSQVPQYGVIYGSGDQGGDFLFVRSGS
jgi:hypothetical protein